MSVPEGGSDGRTHRLQLRHGRGLRRLHARARRRDHQRARHVGQHRVRVPRGRSRLDASHGPLAEAARRRRRARTPASRTCAGFRPAEHAARSAEEIRDDLVYQIGALTAFTRAKRLQHVKPHGALYNMAVERERPRARHLRGGARGRPAAASSSCWPGRGGSEMARRDGRARGARGVRRSRVQRRRHPGAAREAGRGHPRCRRGRRAQPAAGDRRHA